MAPSGARATPARSFGGAGAIEVVGLNDGAGVTTPRDVTAPPPGTDVAVGADGAGVIHAKAWKKGEAEPEKWDLDFAHKTAHQNGSPGFFCLTPQEQRAWIDNIEVKAN